MFTGALFLSGYVLQQQTVRDLRAAIQPKPTPDAARLYLPAQFAEQTTPSPKAELNEYLSADAGENRKFGDGKEVVEVKGSSSEKLPTDTSSKTQSLVLDEKGGGESRLASQSLAQDLPVGVDAVRSQNPMLLQKDPHSELPDGAEMTSKSPAKTQPKEKPISKAERRKKIKEEIMAAGDGEGFKGYKRRQW
jgi:hypothetical protein